MDFMKLLDDGENFGKLCMDIVEKDYDEKTKERLKKIRERGPKEYNLPKSEVFISDKDSEEVDFLLDAMDEAKNKFRE